MTKKLLKVEDVRQLLEREVEKYGSQRAVARHAGVSVQFLSKVLAGEVPPGDKLPLWLGLEEDGMRWRKRTRHAIKAVRAALSQEEKP